MLASSLNATDVVELLLQYPSIDVNVIDPYGNTALLYDSRGGYTNVVRLLLECDDIDVNTRSRSGCTALMLASFTPLRNTN